MKKPSDVDLQNLACEKLLPVLIAPNVSEQMGGEAMKALQIFRELKKKIPRAIQITHERNREELTGRLGLSDVYYVEDTWFASMLWRSRVFRHFLNVWFSFKAVRLAEKILAERLVVEGGVRGIIHQTEPNSPVAIRALSSTYANVAGPINGNIYYPPCFRGDESHSAKVRRLLHMPLQRLQALTYSSLSRMDLILCAGGGRTMESLVKAGCDEVKIYPTVDCGVPGEMLDRKALKLDTESRRFIHFGRLVFHKGTLLIIEALARPGNDVNLDIVGRGPELERCKALVESLGLSRRVRFLDWYPRHEDLQESFEKYCGMVLPSFEDANGIVVQEAMAVGLPPICLNWGGPQLLVTHSETGLLVEALSREQIISDLSVAMQKLADSSDMAKKISAAARLAAETWRWDRVIEDWVGMYIKVISKTAVADG